LLAVVGEGGSVMTLMATFVIWYDTSLRMSVETQWQSTQINKIMSRFDFQNCFITCHFSYSQFLLLVYRRADQFILMLLIISWALMWKRELW
jgi:hypothetical protein